MCWCTGWAWWIWCTGIWSWHQFTYEVNTYRSEGLLVQFDWEMSLVILYGTSGYTVVWWCILTDSVNEVWYNFRLDQSIEEVKYSISNVIVAFYTFINIDCWSTQSGQVCNATEVTNFPINIWEPSSEAILILTVGKCSARRVHMFWTKKCPISDTFWVVMMYW